MARRELDGQVARQVDDGRFGGRVRRGRVGCAWIGWSITTGSFPRDVSVGPARLLTDGAYGEACDGGGGEDAGGVVDGGVFGEERGESGEMGMFSM